MLSEFDPELNEIYHNELLRQSSTLSLIPSENIASKNVLKAIGSIFTNKYSEGEPSKRYYQGNKNVDALEFLVNKRVRDVFELNSNWHINVKAVSESIANFAILNALLKPGDKIMSMFLFDGGHLSHGWKMPSGKQITVASRIFNVVQYHVDPETKVFNYDDLEVIAKKEKPDLIITGGTGYPREINYKRMSEIAKKIGAMYFADVSHEAGLIAGKSNSSPFQYADIVSMSTQKTLRGPRAAIICCNKTFGEAIDKSIFPGIQGGPFDHHMFALGVCLQEALNSDFQVYAKQTVKNAKAMAKALISNGFNLVAGGTDKHLLLMDLSDRDYSGKQAAQWLEDAGIVSNYNTIPFDRRKPFNPSGVRLGSPAITTRGMREKEAVYIADLIKQVLDSPEDNENIADVRAKVKKLCTDFPVNSY